METDYKALYEKARLDLNEVKADLRLANAKLEGNPCTIGIIREGKIWRQQNALRNLNRRVRVQRLQLRRLNELERGLRPEEWQALKEEFAAELAEDVFETFK